MVCSIVPVWVLCIPGSLPGDTVFEDLSSIDLLLKSTTGDQSVDDNILVLSDSERSVHRLGISCWVPARVN